MYTSRKGSCELKYSVTKVKLVPEVWVSSRALTSKKVRLEKNKEQSGRTELLVNLRFNF